jgi:hypothetical protein
MPITEKINLKELYEIDDYLWIQETVKLLKEKQFNQLDLENLIEELEDWGSEKKHAIESLLEQIIRHLLLLEYWASEYEQNRNHWRAEIVSFRTQINKKITTNFYNYLNQNLAEIYDDARLYVIEKSSLETFPEQCPYTLDQLLDKHWFPLK